MLIKALACDLGGTLAVGDRISSKVRETLQRVRQAGVRLILVTGRTFFEVTRVCDCLELFDAVVAENGAVVYYPASAMIRDHELAVPARLSAELDQRGIQYQTGRVIIGAARGDEVAVREALAGARVTRDVIHDRGGLMLVPAGVSKGSGVQQVLRTLGLSPHDVLAIGDGESDLPLFDACGFSACPGDSIGSVRERVDWVLPGGHGDDVASGIAELVLEPRVLVQRLTRHRIALGWVAATGEPVSIPARAVNVLVHGDSHSGKSWLAGALVERLVGARYAVCVIDPEGDYRVLAHLPGMTVASIQAPGEVDDALAWLQSDPTRSLTLDLSSAPYQVKVSLAERALRAMRDLRQRVGRPHWVVVDEAHYSLGRGGLDPDASGLEDRGFCLVTYRPSQLGERVVGAMDVFILARTTALPELEFLRAALPSVGGAAGPLADALGQLPRGEFVLLQRGPGGRAGVCTFVVAPRQTLHVRHRAKYVDSLVSPGREFFFRRPDGQVRGAADSLQSFRRVVAIAPDDVLAHHAGRGDFSRWVNDVFGDAELARQLRKAEARWRRGELSELRRVIDALVTVRYGGDESPMGAPGVSVAWTIE